jgi:hypothetical protein
MLSDRQLKFDPFAMWMNIIHLVPSNLRPDYHQDRTACKLLVHSLVSLGTNHLLDKDKNHVPIAGLVAQTY